MLAKAAAAAAPLPPVSSNFSRKPVSFSNVNLIQSRCCSNKSNITSMRWSTRRMVVRASYKKRQLETPGAYELVDEETGDKVIVWGGTEDDARESPIPPKDVLNWKPNNKSSRSRSRNVDKPDVYRNKHQETTTTTTKGANGGSFGRLKSQRVRDLIRMTSNTKQGTTGHNYDAKIANEASIRGSVSSDAEPELLLAKKRLDIFKRRTTVSKSSKPEDTQGMMQEAMGREDIDHSEIAIELGVEQLSKYQTRSTNLQESGNDVSGSRVLAASLGGWSDGASTRDSIYQPIDILKKRHKSNVDTDFFSRKSFRDMGCSDYMIESLKGRLFLRPSHIQAMAFPTVIEGKSCIIADQSGSGKTLAYLLPVVQRLRQEELQGLGKSLPQKPRVVILVPTAELASQVLSNCRLMSKFGVPFRSMVVTGGFRQKTQLENLQLDLDVLIATPGRFLYLVKEGFLQLTNLKCAVLDEVDILFNDEDFEQVLQSLIISAPVTTQYLFVTATLPVMIYNKVVEGFPDCEVIMGPGMHRTSPGLEEVLVDCSGEDGTEKTPDTAFQNKKTALLQLVDGSPVAKTIVFCNKIETCRKVENSLKRVDKKGINTKVLPFHAALAQESRVSNMREFCTSVPKDTSLVLVCTDRASRGIDFAGVDHVVLFDFPRDPSEYVRRVGRTARGAGGKGKAFIFVVGKQVSLARRIIERNRKGHPLHDVPAMYAPRS